MSAPVPLSVIIPTFNRYRLTKRAILSVLNQEDPIGVEIVVSDDGSSDDSAQKLLDEFKAEQNRVKFLVNSHSGDPGHARNQGIQQAQGEWIAFLDSDDVWKNNRLKWLSPLLNRYDFIASTNRGDFWNPNSEPKDALAEMIRMNWILTSSVVCKKNLIEEAGGFPTGYFEKSFFRKLPGFEDYELWIRLLIRLYESDRQQRFLLCKNSTIETDPQEGGAGDLSVRNQMMREAATLLRLLPDTKKTYWLQILKRFLGAVKASVHG